MYFKRAASLSVGVSAGSSRARVVLTRGQTRLVRRTGSTLRGLGARDGKRPSVFWETDTTQPFVQCLVLQYPVLRSVILARPRHPRVPSCERIDFRLKVERLGKRRLRSIDVTLKRQSSGEPVRKIPVPRVCGAPLDERVYRLV